MFCKIRDFILNKYIKKIILTGPESTGKSTLAQQLAEYYQTVWVPEYARMYLETLSKPYEQKDLLEIAKGQIEMENYLLQFAKDFIFCDTNLIVMKIWSEYKYGICHPWILEQLEKKSYDLYVLCGIDVPWEFDVQREHPTERKKLFDLYEQELIFYKKKYIKIEGSKEKRLSNVLASLENI